MRKHHNLRTFIVYDIPRLARNRWLVETLTEKFTRHGLTLELKLAEDLRQNDTYFTQKDALPDAVIMRCIAPDISRRWEALGVRVFNSAQVSEISNDKLRTLSFAAQLGIAVMESYPFDPEKEKQNHFSSDFPLSFPFVLKSIDGHGGSEVFKVENAAYLTQLFCESEHAEEICRKRWLIQTFCDSPGRDVRVYIVGNRVVAAMERRSLSDFRSNYSLGGVAAPYTLNDAENDVISKVLNALSLDFVGIDIIFHGGRPILNEIEDVVGFRMLCDKTNIDVLEIFMTHFIKEMSEMPVTPETSETLETSVIPETSETLETSVIPETSETPENQEREMKE